MPPTFVREISAPGFQKDVVERSMTTPVLLDFWAAWCGPCRTLGPVLERLAAEYAGGFELGKVDTEREPELAQAFGVQGIPYCVLVDGGRPVDAFTGALPDAEIRRFLERNGVQAVVGAKPEAAAAPIDPNSPAERLRRGREAAARGDLARLRQVLDGFPEEDERSDSVNRLLGGVEWLEWTPLASEPEAGQLLMSSRRLFLASDLEGAMDQILESVRRDRGYRGGLARRAMLFCFAVFGEDREELDAYRRRLATILY